MTELESGVVLGRYELLVRIGRGGMASVWVARERSAVSGKQRLVAVKAMLPELAAHSEFRSMFLGEVQIIQAINHDNVVRVFEVSEDHGTLYMAMEWVEGDSLRSVIKAAKSRGALPPEIAVRIAADAAAGLHAAHELRDWDGELRGVVHCDVSPHNILLGIDGKAKLVDFGIANAMGQLESSGDGEKIKGKLSYMSPEQARGERVDRRTDVFALGIVLFELTTGEQLFKGRTGTHTLELVRRGIIPRPSTLNPRFPQRLEAIVMRALEREPARRYQTASEFEQALTGFLYEERILVSHAAVTQLLLRVTGPRIEKRREVIARVIQAVDGQPNADPGAHQIAALADLSPMHSDPFNYTLTNAGDDSSLGIAARLEAQAAAAPPVPVLIEDDAVLIEPEARQIPWLWVSIGGIALILGVLVIYLLASSSDSSAVEPTAISQPTGAVASSTAPEATATTTAETSKPKDRVVSAENLPVAGESTSSGSSSRRSSRGRSGPKAMVVDLDSTPSELSNSDRGSGASSEPEDKAGGSGAGINRAAANAALATAAAAAKACRNRGESPTGPGRAAVTFGPDGSATAVSVSQRFSGTAIGGCVTSQFRQARAPAFNGEPTTLFYPFEIPD